MPREQIEDVVARPVEVSATSATRRCKLALLPAKQTRVRGVLDERVVEDDRRDASFARPFEETAVHKLLDRLVDGAIADDCRQERDLDPRPITDAV